MTEDTLDKWTQIHSKFRKQFTRNISDDHPRRKSAWHDGMPVIAMATDLQYEMQAKCQPVHQSLQIKWHRGRY